MWMEHLEFCIDRQWFDDLEVRLLIINPASSYDVDLVHVGCCSQKPDPIAVSDLSLVHLQDLVETPVPPPYLLQPRDTIIS